MPIPAFARAIPNDVLQTSDMNDMADQWQQDQMSKLADDWANAQQAAPPSPMPAPADAGDRQSQAAGVNAVSSPAAEQPGPSPAAPSAVSAPSSAPVTDAATFSGGPQSDAPDLSAPATQTTAELSGAAAGSGRFGDRERGIMSRAADTASWLGPDGQKVLQAVLTTEGGMSGAVGDHGQSFGPLQFYSGGQLANFASQHGMTQAAAGRYVVEHPDEAIQWAIGTPDKPGYLGGTIARGQQAGLNGADLATYAQQHGQVSVSPERAGKNYTALFGGGGGPVSGGGAAAAPDDPSIVQSIQSAISGGAAAVKNAAGQAVQAVQGLGKTDQPGPPIQGDYASILPGGTQNPVQAGLQAAQSLRDLTGPSVLDQAKSGVDIEAKYGGGVGPDGKYRAPDYSNITPEDQQTLNQSGIAVGGMTTGDASTPGRPLFGRGGVPGADVGRQPNLRPPTQPGDVTQALVDTLRMSGKSDEQIGALLKSNGASDADVAQVLGTPAAAPAAPPVRDDWPTQLNNLKNTDAFKGAPPSQQTQMIADAQGQFGGQSTLPPVGPMQNVTPTGGLAPGVQNIPGRQGGAVQDTGAPPGGKPNLITSAENTPGQMPPQQPLPNKAGINAQTVQIAHERIDKAIDVGDPRNQAAHDQLDQMIQSGADPGAIARFLSSDVEGKSIGPTDVLRTLRTGALAGGLTTEGKVALSPIIQTAMRAPVAAIKALVTGNPSAIPAGLQGGLSGLADAAGDALQTTRYGTNYRAALTGGALGGQSLPPGLDVLGKNPITRAAGAGMLGLVRTHGAISDLSAGIGRGAALATGATPAAAEQSAQQWALRSGNYGTVGQKVADALEGLRQTNPALNVVGQILIPFYRVGYNGLTQGVERSPLGLVGTGVDVARGALGSGPYAAGADASHVTPVGDRLANNLFGVGLAATGMAEAAQGNLTGERPANGAPKWSIRVAGNWVPIRTLGPAGEALAQSAALYEAARDGKGDIAKQAELTAGAYVSHIQDETWVGNIAQLFSTIGDLADVGNANANVARGAQSDLSYQARSLGSDNLKSVIPQSTLIGQTAKIAGAPDLAGTLLQAAGVQPTQAGRPKRPAPVSTRPSRPSR